MNNYLTLPVLGIIPALLLACGGSDSANINTNHYTVTITNTTHNQPLSPPAVLIFDGATKAWNIGLEASHGLEVLAESGSPTDFVEEANNSEVSATGTDIITPGDSAVFELEVDKTNALTLTLVTMLVNTNDAFTGITSWNIGHLKVGDRLQTLAPVYDAGTEFNDELAAYIPGPAGGGAGFGEERESANQVTRHPGVVTTADGYAESTLDESHKFDNGAALIVVERTQ